MTDWSPATTGDTHLSVIVPFHGARPHAFACAAALASQSYAAERFDLTAVDCGSAGDLREIARRHPGMRVLPEPSGDSYAARNRGVAESKAAILCFTNADCAPAPDWLWSIARAMADESVRVVLGRVVMTGSRALDLLSAYEDERAGYVFSGSTAELYYGHANNMAVRRTAFDALGPFPEGARGGDVVLVRRAVDAYGTNAVRYEPRMVVRHLEITSHGAWIRKMFVNGRTASVYRPVVATRSMTEAERAEVFRRTIRRHGFSRAQSGLLFLLLAAGVAAHRLGRILSLPDSPRRP